ncbi:MAG: AAA family ATPase [Lachnospiraceae bacterium]|nr:AAA family ATPase [Lachnospiraceae bacterium]
MYIQRHLETQILEASRYYPVVMVCGQRQVGKSTMLNHLREPGRRYVTLDDMNARRMAEQDAGLFFETYKAPLLIDEFQRVPSLLLEMKRIVDQASLNGEDVNGQYWLTGSQKFPMMEDVAESLAGRVAVFDLSGLSTAEIEGRSARLFRPDLDHLRERMEENNPKTIHQIFERIFRGGMPKLIATDIDRDRYYMDYVNTYIERDIKGLAQVGKLSAFYDFLVFIAARSSGELRYEEIANAVGVSAPTAKSWVSIKAVLILGISVVVIPLVANAIVCVFFVIPLLQVGVMVILVEQDDDVLVLRSQRNNVNHDTFPFSVGALHPLGIDIVAALIHITVTVVVEVALLI